MGVDSWLLAQQPVAAVLHVSLVTRKPDFCLCKNCTADQRLRFCYTDSSISTINLLKSEISSS